MKRSAWRFLWSAKDIPPETAGDDRPAGRLPAGGARACTWSQPGGDCQYSRRWGRRGDFIQLTEHALGRYSFKFLCAGDGCLPVHHRTDHPAVAGAHHPRPTKADGRRSTRGPKVDGEMDYILAVPMAALQAVGQINLFSSFTGGQPIIDNFWFQRGKPRALANDYHQYDRRDDVRHLVR